MAPAVTQMRPNIHKDKQRHFRFLCFCFWFISGLSCKTTWAGKSTFLGVWTTVAADDFDKVPKCGGEIQYSLIVISKNFRGRKTNYTWESYIWLPRITQLDWLAAASLIIPPPKTFRGVFAPLRYLVRGDTRILVCFKNALTLQEKADRTTILCPHL